MADQELKTVAWFRDAMSADICVGMLKENGIMAAAFGQCSSYTSLNYVKEIEVKVNPEDFEAALDLVKQAGEA